MEFGHIFAVLKKKSRKEQKILISMMLVNPKAIYLWTKTELKVESFKFIAMTKADIVNEISKNTGIEKVTVQKAVEAFMDTVSGSLAEGNNVYLRGFGSFIVKKRAEKTARNISRNTTIIIPEHFIPSFKPAKTFVGRVKSNVK
jgi:DNA-binding protein HU-beta